MMRRSCSKHGRLLRSLRQMLLVPLRLVWHTYYPHPTKGEEWRNGFQRDQSYTPFLRSFQSRGQVLCLHHLCHLSADRVFLQLFQNTPGSVPVFSRVLMDVLNVRTLVGGKWMGVGFHEMLHSPDMRIMPPNVVREHCRRDRKRLYTPLHRGQFSCKLRLRRTH